jgi:SAM-dependent methyltransferase
MEEQDALKHSLQALAGLDNYNRWIYDNISRFLGSNILEIGCGIGNITDYFITPGKKITGIDISDEFTAIAAKKYRDNPDVTIVTGDALNSSGPLPSGSFDTVVLLNVLEHIKEEKAAMKLIHNMLVTGGRAIILVPAMRFAFGALDKNLGHHKRYERSDMTRVFKEEGFETEKIFYMNWPGAIGWAINSRLLKKKFIPEGQAVLFNNLFVPFLKITENYIAPPFGQSLIAVARKR